MSFWIPGFFGSLAAAPLQPGWTLQTNYYHTSVSAGAEVARAREITIGRIPININANLSATLDARADLGWALPIYTFATPPSKLLHPCYVPWRICLRALEKHRQVVLNLFKDTDRR